MPAPRSVSLACCVVLLGLTLPLAADDPKPAATDEAKPVKLPMATGEIKIDGVLDEPAWKEAPAIPVDFIMGKTGQKAEKSPMTARFTWNADYLFIGYETFDTNLTPRASGEVEGPPTNRREGASIWHPTEPVDVVEFFISTGDLQFFWEIHHNAKNEFNDVFCVTFDEKRPIAKTALGRFGIHFGHAEWLQDDTEAGKTLARAVTLKPKADGKPSTPNDPSDTDTGYIGEIRIPWAAVGGPTDRETWIKIDEEKRKHGPWKMDGLQIQLLAVAQDGDRKDRYHHSSATFPGGWFHHGAPFWPKYVLTSKMSNDQ